MKSFDIVVNRQQIGSFCLPDRLHQCDMFVSSLIYKAFLTPEETAGVLIIKQALELLTSEVLSEGNSGVAVNSAVDGITMIRNVVAKCDAVLDGKVELSQENKVELHPSIVGVKADVESLSYLRDVVPSGDAARIEISCWMGDMRVDTPSGRMESTITIGETVIEKIYVLNTVYAGQSVSQDVAIGVTNSLDIGAPIPISASVKADMIKYCILGRHDPEKLSAMDNKSLHDNDVEYIN